MAKGAAGETDFPTSLAAAQGVAGRSWLSAADSPLSPAIRLPLTEANPSGAPVLAAEQSGSPPSWLVWGLAGLAVLLLLTVIALVFVLLRFTKKKGATP